MIIPKLSRVCRYLSKLLIANLSFRLSIRVFCRNFVDIFREFSETAGKIPKKESDRNEWLPDKFQQILQEINMIQYRKTMKLFWTISSDVQQCQVMSNDFCPIWSKDVQDCQVMSNYVQNLRNVTHFCGTSACTGYPWACFLTCNRNRDTTSHPILCKYHKWCISLHPVCTKSLFFFPLSLCTCDRFRCKPS